MLTFLAPAAAATDGAKLTPVRFPAMSEAPALPGVALPPMRTRFLTGISVASLFRPGPETCCTGILPPASTTLSPPPAEGSSNFFSKFIFFNLFPLLLTPSLAYPPLPLSPLPSSLPREWGVRLTLLTALPLYESREERERFHREGVMLDTMRPSMPRDGESGSGGVPATSSAGRFFPVEGNAVSAAAETVAGVRGGRGGSCCSGVWKVDPPGEEGSSDILLLFNERRRDFWVMKKKIIADASAFQ
mmetsp:Transcript_15015/g.32767  ORF Transcript_15015/g.32767 Transcript_15015/m.32767 type:complete len:246 (+) Transcript_15015:513-1250(+)